MRLDNKLFFLQWLKKWLGMKAIKITSHLAFTPVEVTLMSLESGWLGKKFIFFLVIETFFYLARHHAYTPW